MSIYTIFHDHNYSNISFVDLDDYDDCGDVVRPFIGEKASHRYSHKWKALYGDDSLKRPNCPYLGAGYIVIDEQAKEILMSHIGHEVELLPIDIEGQPHYIVNIINVIDCLDKENSEIKYFKSNPTKIMRIVKHVFHEEHTVDSFMFKLPSITPMFCTQKFKDLVEQNEITGLRFDRLK